MYEMSDIAECHVAAVTRAMDDGHKMTDIVIEFSVKLEPASPIILASIFIHETEHSMRAKSGRTTGDALLEETAALDVERVFLEGLIAGRGPRKLTRSEAELAKSRMAETVELLARLQKGQTKGLLVDDHARVGRCVYIKVPAAIRLEPIRESRKASRRERLRGSHIEKRFCNARGLVSNLGSTKLDGDEFKAYTGKDVFAVAVETEAQMPSRVLRLGAVPFDAAELLVQRIARANPTRRIILAKLIGALKDEEVYEVVSEFKAQEATIICATG